MWKDLRFVAVACVLCIVIVTMLKECKPHKHNYVEIDKTVSPYTVWNSTTQKRDTTGTQTTYHLRCDKCGKMNYYRLKN